jgi:hypothetical protein
MKNLIAISLLSMIFLSPEAIAWSQDPFAPLKSRINELDLPDASREIDNDTVMSWWSIADKNVLRVYNDVFLGETPYKRFNDDNSSDSLGTKACLKTRDAVTCKYYSAPPAFLTHESPKVEKWNDSTLTVQEDGRLHWYFNELLPPEGTSLPFSITIFPLTSDQNILFAYYERLGNVSEISNLGVSSIGTFRIMEKKPATNKWTITATFETTNFYFNIATLRLFKYRDGSPVPKYAWKPEIKPQSIVRKNAILNFQIEYDIFMAGYPNDVGVLDVSWQYDAQHKLKAKEYVYRSEYMPQRRDYDPNLKLSEKIRNGEPVPIPP